MKRVDYTFFVSKCPVKGMSFSYPCIRHSIQFNMFAHAQRIYSSLIRAERVRAKKQERLELIASVTPY